MWILFPNFLDFYTCLFFPTSIFCVCVIYIQWPTSRMHECRFNLLQLLSLYSFMQPPFFSSKVHFFINCCLDFCVFVYIKLVSMFPFFFVSCRVYMYDFKQQATISYFFFLLQPQFSVFINCCLFFLQQLPPSPYECVCLYISISHSKHHYIFSSSCCNCWREKEYLNQPTNSVSIYNFSSTVFFLCISIYRYIKNTAGSPFSFSNSAQQIQLVGFYSNSVANSFSFS